MVPFRFLAFAIVFPLGPFAAAAEPSPQRREWKIDGNTREALVYVPDAAATTGTPVVFAFHGHGGSAKNAAAMFAFQKHWPAAIAVYMQGLPTPGKTDPEGKRPGWQRSPGDQDDRDLKFFDAVLATLQKDYKVDERRVYASGYSNGGGFTYLLWSARGDAFAAVAPCASSGGSSRNFQNLKPKPALHVAGEDDEIVPFENQKKVIDVIHKLNGCDTNGVEWAKDCTLYPSRTGNPFVTFIHPGGHNVPEAAPELIVKFFKEHAKDGRADGPAGRAR